MISTPRDLTGQRFGKLVVLSKEVVRDRYKWKCTCDCGSTSYVLEANLIRRHTNSCGCLRKESIGNRNKHHGRSREPEFLVWKNMKYIANGSSGRPIVPIEPAWQESYESFYNDMGPKPTLKHKFNRIDHARGFVKGNCIWRIPPRVNYRKSDS